MLSQTAVYAVRAMSYMASHDSGSPVLARTIAEKMDIPRNFLSKILHRLVQEGYLESTRGTKGGFRLRRPPHEVTLYEIASLFMSFDRVGPCFLGLSRDGCSCKLREKWAPIVERFLDLLRETTLDQVI